MKRQCSRRHDLINTQENASSKTVDQRRENCDLRMFLERAYPDQQLRL